MMCAVCYVTSMSIVCCYFYANKEAFTGSDPPPENCFATSESNVPVSVTNVDATDVSQTFFSMIRLGMVTHLLGIIGDGSFAARIYVKNTPWFRLAALIAVSLYTILWLGWLIWLHVVVFNHEGKVCSGYYLPEEARIPQPGYAIR